MSEAAMMLVSIGLGVVAGLGVLFLTARLAPADRPRPRGGAGDALAEPRRFVFRNGYLVEHTDNVAFLLPAPIDHLRAWNDLSAALDEMIEGTSRALAGLRDSGRPFRLEGRFGRDAIHVLGARDGSDLHVTVAASDAREGSLRVGIEGLRGLESEVALLTETADTSPTPSWVVDAEGRVIWGNGAYQALARRLSDPEALLGWPLPTLFPLDGKEATRSRRHVVDGEGRSLWFDLAVPVEAGRARHLHAIPIDATVAAERNLSTFIQTLTKTFAHLSTGLAIFDREQALVMFNPALVDMTGLDPLWLSRRPKLADFFDALRERRQLPEPRDYKAWREGLNDYGRIDARGTYTETWTLPGGQTYCVVGRPQADGAVALILEDVTADLSAATRHKAEREALAAALDIGGEAVFVFGANGALIAANADARAQAEGVPDGLEDAIHDWQQAFEPSPAWADLRAAAHGDGTPARQEVWTRTLSRPDGSPEEMRVLPILGGGLAVAFAGGRQATAAPARAPEALRIAAQ